MSEPRRDRFRLEPGPNRRPPIASPGVIAADAIIVAAGASSRMGGRDKMALSIGGQPLLAWTLAAVASAPEVDRIVLVVSAEGRPPVSSAAWLPAKVGPIVLGGARRQDSVAVGFEALEALDRAGSPTAGAEIDGRVVLVHDGARPAVSVGLIGAVARAAATHGVAIPIVPLIETVKRLDGDLVAETLDRSNLGVAQTPQGFRRDVLRAAFEKHPAAGPETWTDEAALMEACRIAVHAIPGDVSNVKVTNPDDVGRAAAVLLGDGLRIGFGEDSHPFGPGQPLALGGVTIDGAPRLAGHSDGDVALHAVADALLGAASLGDLGRLFPAGPATPAGISSAELVRAVVRRLAGEGLRPAWVDLTIVAARPRLADRLEAMRAAIGDLLELPVARVSVKASTGNLAGPDGAGRGISARAVACVAARS